MVSDIVGDPKRTEKVKNRLGGWVNMHRARGSTFPTRAAGEGAFTPSPPTSRYLGFWEKETFEKSPKIAAKLLLSFSSLRSMMKSTEVI